MNSVQFFASLAALTAASIAAGATMRVVNDCVSPGGSSARGSGNHPCKIDARGGTGGKGMGTTGHLNLDPVMNKSELPDARIIWTPVSGMVRDGEVKVSKGKTIVWSFKLSKANIKAMNSQKEVVFAFDDSAIKELTRYFEKGYELSFEVSGPATGELQLAVLN